MWGGGTAPSKRIRFSRSARGCARARVCSGRQPGVSQHDEHGIGGLCSFQRHALCLLAVAPRRHAGWLLFACASAWVCFQGEKSGFHPTFFGPFQVGAAAAVACERLFPVRTRATTAYISHAVAIIWASNPDSRRPGGLCACVKPLQQTPLWPVCLC